ncbi:MAG: phage DNA encapsidation protein [Methanobrevibacter sp.]|nr:phage DNA encapsidation protein [Methanobrevibacter sp.]
MKYWTRKRIKAVCPNAQYYMIFSERSDGKTYDGLYHGFIDYYENGNQFAYVRRWVEDLKGKRAKELFTTLEHNGEGVNVIEKVTKGKWNKVVFKFNSWWLAKFDKELNTDIIDEKPMCYAFVLSQMEHDKSVTYPMIKTIIFDEFLTRQGYLADEFVIFMNLLSTIIRLRNDVEIWMYGNTISTSCPYFIEMGIKNIKKMKQGTIDVYTYGESNMKVAVEFGGVTRKEKKSNIYFAFDNPKLAMIRGDGKVWEIGLYPHLPIKYKYDDVFFTYFIIFEGDILQCELIDVDDGVFTYVHRKTTPIRNDDDIVFKTEYSIKPNEFRKLNHPQTKVESNLYDFFLKDRVFYQDNEVGEIVRSYFEWCDRSGLEELG